jgi:hypothetical protein
LWLSAEAEAARVLPGARFAKAYCDSAVLPGTGYTREAVRAAASAVVLSGGPKGCA